MGREKRRLWMRLDTLIGPVRVYVVRRMSIEGDANHEKGLVRIRSHKNVTLMKMTLLHELTHIALSPYSGGLRKVAKLHKYKIEERALSLLEPMLYDLLSRNAMLVIPDPPEF